MQRSKRIALVILIVCLLMATAASTAVAATWCPSCSSQPCCRRTVSVTCTSSGCDPYRPYFIWSGQWQTTEKKRCLGGGGWEWVITSQTYDDKCVADWSCTPLYNYTYDLDC